MIAMNAAEAYAEKFERCQGGTLFPQLDPRDQEFVRSLAARHRFSHQELKQVSEAALDLRMWRETPLREWWQRQEDGLALTSRPLKKELFRRLRGWLGELRSEAAEYPEGGLEKPRQHSLELAAGRSDKKIMGLCPVASEETVCCNLRTLDAVESCGFGCSYCTIQTFYGDRVVFDADLRRKLSALELDPERFYHVGTGQSSDALMWGNRHGILDALCEFAEKSPNVVLELKTKSKNVAYFLGRPLPRNLVLSWSLNPPAVIRNEEHFTAGLDERLAAARRVADKGVKVAFHCHPILHYKGWRADYRDLARRALDRFDPDEVLFLSFGSLTFIKPVIRAVRQRGRESKILQAELVPGAKGKLSYPEPLKKEMFRHLHRSFAPWHGRVYMYLCMEEASYWHSTFGFAYPSNEQFEADFGREARAKIGM
ncbi:MAG: hypothetical protein GY719_13825 [bacterium]|nr:hypothetical protein [bacterium]